jgi:A/G-specific adenine glycosylase
MSVGQRSRGKTAGRRAASSRTLRHMVETVSAWFEISARDLPWRNQRTPYRALVSEFMLQQTQVSRVIGPYRKFLRRFPSVRSLAAANEQDVLAMWQGLGYYRRARNLHAAAKMIVQRFKRRVPSSINDLRQLPGVGRYTAGAIASIVFHEPVPIVDGNVQRVLTRVFGKRPRRQREDLNAWSWRAAAELIALAARPGVFNEGLMELGALVCLPAPAMPRCDVCPLATWCGAKRSGVQRRAALTTARAKPQTAHHHAVIVRNAQTGRILVEQRPSAGMWSNMWQVPTIEATSPIEPREVVSTLRSKAIRNVRKIATFRHLTTHRRITFHVYCATGELTRGTWRNSRGLETLPMSSPQRRIVDMAARIKGD